MCRPSRPRVKRPEFEHLMEDLERGFLDGLVVYDLDRFARQPLDLERSIRIFDSRKLVFATVQSDIDLSTSDGRTMARIMVAFANKTSMDTSRRVRRKHLELAQTGVPTGRLAAVRLPGRPSNLGRTKGRIDPSGSC
jgi:site-specific DNA recombinase